jgi:hypothetical protein
MTFSSPPSVLPAIDFLAEVDSRHREFLSSFGEFVRPKKDELAAFFAADVQGGVKLMQGRLRRAAKRTRAMNSKLIEFEAKSSSFVF